MRGLVRGLCVSFAFVAITGVAQAAAPTTKLKWDHCVGNDPRTNCTPIPHSPIDDTWGMTVSPDDHELYAADGSSGTLTEFTRSSTGRLTYAGCIADLGDHGCEPATLNSLGDLTAMAMSPAGNSIYVTTEYGPGAVTWFARAPDGALTYQGCFANDGRAGCQSPGNEVFGSPDAIAVSPDGRSVYVATEEHVLAEFDRAPDGSLTYRGCFANRGRHGCEAPKVDSLPFATSLAISPDGKSLYVGGYDDAISIFSRHSNGSLSYRGCITDEHAPPKCGQYTNPDVLVFNESLAVTPDGKSLLVSADKTLASFQRRPDGSLKLSQCFAAPSDRQREKGCEQVGQVGFKYAEGIAVSDDGRTVDLPAGEGNSSTIVEFHRSPRGKLSLAGCIATGKPTTPCSETKHSEWDETRLVALSHDGKSIYAGGYRTITRFQRRSAKVPGGHANEPESISYWDPDHAVLGTGNAYRGHGGTIKVTADGGTTFQRALRTDDAVTWVDTAGTSNAWAVTKDRRRDVQFLRSRDGGRTWKELPEPPGDQPSFATAQFGVAGTERSLYSTTDGGKTWAKLPDKCHGEAMAVSASSADDLLQACGGEEGVGGQPKAVFESHDGGQHWKILAQAGWATGDPWDGRAPNGGLSGVGYIQGLVASPPGDAMLFMDEYALATTDGGANWQELDLPSPVSAWSGQMLTPEDWVAMDPTYLIETHDAGKTWTLVHRFPR